MITAIIVEDEPHARQLLKKYIGLYCPDINVVGAARSATEAYDIIDNQRPKLLFLDIEIANEHSPETSFDLLARLPTYHYEVIFVTAFNQYALKAIKCHALDYLLKPINISELENAVAIARQRFTKPDLNQQLTSLITAIKTPNPTKARIWVPTSEGLQGILINQIIRFEAAERYTYIHSTSQPVLLACKHLREYIDMLSEKNFFLSHRSHLINLDYVDRYNLAENTAIMSTGTAIPVSRRRKQEFLDRLNNL